MQLTDPNFLANLAREQQLQQSMATNTQNFQQAVQGNSKQVLDATNAERAKLAQSGLGNTGAAIFNSLNTQASNDDLMNKVKQTSLANQQAVQGIDLQDNSLRSSLETEMSKMFRNAYATKELANTGNGYNFNGNMISGTDMNSLMGNINSDTGDNLAGPPPSANIDFNKKNKK